MLWIIGSFVFLGMLLGVLRGEDRADPGCLLGRGLGDAEAVEFTKRGRAPTGTIDLVERSHGEWGVYLDGRPVGYAVDGKHSRSGDWVCPGLCGPSPLRRERREPRHQHRWSARPRTTMADA